jgi:ribosomal protein L40E
MRFEIFFEEKFMKKICRIAKNAIFATSKIEA